MGSIAVGKVELGFRFGAEKGLDNTVNILFDASRSVKIGGGGRVSMDVVVTLGYSDFHSGEFKVQC